MFFSYVRTHAHELLSRCGLLTKWRPCGAQKPALKIKFIMFQLGRASLILCVCAVVPAGGGELSRSVADSEVLKSEVHSVCTAEKQKSSWLE